MARVPRDVVLLPEGSGRWVAMNVFARTCLGVGPEVLALLESAEAGAPPPAGPFRVWEIQRFSNEDGLLADPSRYVRDPEAWPEPEQLDAASTLERLRKRLVLVEDEAAYRARFAPKRDLLDAERIGNFHQQLGQHLLLVRREAPGKWWLRQKFDDDLRSIRPGPYDYVQLAFLRRFFAERVRPGDNVLDLGCGIGFYSNALASLGAHVLGVDPNAEYIRIASENAAAGATFEVMDVGRPGGLDPIPDASLDLVFMSDALLFYFVPVEAGKAADVEVLVADVRRMLKPGGTFVSLEPHSVFFHLPWLGETDRPFTIATEYLHRTFGITGTISETLAPFLRSGFTLRRFEELEADPTRDGGNERGFEFSRQFPLWQLAELAKE